MKCIRFCYVSRANSIPYVPRIYVPRTVFAKKLRITFFDPPGGQVGYTLLPP